MFKSNYENQIHNIKDSQQTIYLQKNIYIYNTFFCASTITEFKIFGNYKNLATFTKHVLHSSVYSSDHLNILGRN
jgi:hypothetical protein